MVSICFFYIAPGHAFQVVIAAENECIGMFLRDPQDSINLTPCKYYLFSKLKKVFVKMILAQKVTSFIFLRVYLQITVQLRNRTT